MGCSLSMSDEMHDWLADLRGSDPPAAVLVGEALAALMRTDAGLRPPLVIPLVYTVPDDLCEALDERYQLLADWLTDLRRRAARVAGAPDAGEDAERLVQEYRRLEADTQAFRNRKEVLKARYTTAHIGLEIQRDDQAAIAALTAELRDVTAGIERELRRDELPEGLMELRPGAQGDGESDGEISILFGLEPPGGALVIAALEGREAVREHHREAVLLSAQLLREARAGLAPEAAAYAYADTRSFLGEFYPDNADEIDRGAAALAAAYAPRR